ncbi:hypothetical protein VTH06DRAFT_3907 [Thermothelomyces fergusii]
MFSALGRHDRQTRADFGCAAETGFVWIIGGTTSRIERRERGGAFCVAVAFFGLQHHTIFPLSLFSTLLSLLPPGRDSSAIGGWEAVPHPGIPKHIKNVRDIHMGTTVLE